MLSPYHWYIESAKIVWKKIQSYSEGKLNPIDLMKKNSRKFEAVEENIIRYMNARAINYKCEKLEHRLHFYKKSVRDRENIWISQILKDQRVG